MIAGQGPLLWLLAAQILRLGGRIDRILDTTERKNYLAALPHAFAFLTSPYFAKGLALMREVRAKVPVVSGVSELAAAGDGQLATVTYAAGGRRETIPTDLLLLHQGVVPNVNLAMAAGDRASLGRFAAVLVAGARSRRQHVGRGHRDRRRRRRDRRRGSRCHPRPHRCAICGRDAGACGLPRSLHPMATFRAVLAQAERGRAFLDTLFRPAPQFRIPSGDTIVCRCEEVTAKDVLDAVAIGATGPNQLKAYRRTGMGPCQGRLCGLTVTELMAQARGKTPAGDRLLPAPRTGEADHAGGACVRAEDGSRHPGRGARMTKRVDAIIVGGGIHGCSTALHLCLAGMKPVLIEKDYAGRHASGVNAGGVRQLARHVPEIPLSIRSMGIWERIEELLDDDCGFESHGQVLVAENDAEFDALSRARRRAERARLHP